MSTVLKLFKTILFLIHYVLRYDFKMLPTHTTKKTPKQTNKNKHKKKQQQEYSFLNYDFLFKKNIIVKESYKAYFRFFKMFMFGMKVCQLRVFRYQTCNFHGCKTFAKNCFYIAIYPADYSH